MIVDKDAGYSIAEIAKLLHMSELTVIKTLRKFRERLKDRLEDEE